MPNRICQTSSSRIGEIAILAAALSWTQACLAEGSTAEHRAVDTAGVDALFSEAASQFKQGAHAKALASFTRLAELKNSPNVELYIGHCHKELGNDEQAHRAFTRSINRAFESGDPKYTPTREAAQEQLAALNLRLAKLTISLAERTSSCVITLDEKRLSATELGSTIVVSPGVHHIVAEAAGKKTIVRELELEKGSHKTVRLLFERADTLATSTKSDGQIGAPAPPNTQESRGTPWTTYGIAAAGVGLVGFGVFAVAGYQTRSAYDKLQSECSAGCSDTAHRHLIEHGKSSQAIANVGLGVGIVGALAGAGLLYLGYRSEHGAKPGLVASSGTILLSCDGRF